AAFVEGLGRHRTRRTQRRICVRRGEQRWRPKNVPDVVIPRNDPMIDALGIEDRRCLPCAGQEGIGIGQIGIVERIEVEAQGSRRSVRANVHSHHSYWVISVSRQRQAWSLIKNWAVYILLVYLRRLTPAFSCGTSAQREDRRLERVVMLRR